ncbi:putative outer membrane protein [Candidatus Gastranaerophilus sp. (ex Termes propinquus)]|nr:putative outer membrane protein [Candidatus Gastranaerophilus sp. (ex Termes propinquus)]
MKFKIIALLLALCLQAPAFCAIGMVNYNEIVTNYPKAKTAYREIDDRATNLQSFLLDKEKEFKRLDTPVAKKAFEEKTAKEFAQRQEALAKFKAQKEKEISDDIDKVIKAVALESKLDTVVDFRVIYFGGTDITDKVIKSLNTKK